MEGPRGGAGRSTEWCARAHGTSTYYIVVASYTIQYAVTHRVASDGRLVPHAEHKLCKAQGGYVAYA